MSRSFRRVTSYVLIVLAAFFVSTLFLSTQRGVHALQRIVATLPFAENDTEVVMRLTATDPCPADIAKDLDCWDGYYGKLLDRYGSYVALLDLKSRYEGGGYPRLFCHTILHEIGETAGREYSSVAEAYTYGDPFCRSGYYHGVLEGVFGEEGGEKLLSKLDSLCEDVEGKDRYSYDYFACVHGVGHGLMAYFYHDLFKSLASCDRLTGEWEQSSCYGGVFMENVISNTPEEPSKFLKQDDPLYPCNAVEDKYRAQCYLMQTSHMLDIYDGDFARVFDTCSSVEEKYRIPCYQSVGRDASGWSYGSVDDVLGYCGEGNAEQAAQCLAGAAADFIQAQGADDARALCEKGDSYARKVCTDSLESQLKSL